ncbi:MAG: trypsin-like serine protease [Deltaproteobacteria bacterium]|nr:trypsin-like serine protease [Deltaproteobacteria bacterium]
MRRVPVLLPLLLVAPARAEDGGPGRGPVIEGVAEVIGGTNAPDGKWPDAAAVLFNGQQGCSGTLIAPKVVITAGHCNDSQLRSVLVGTASLARPGDGQTIAVARTVEFPNSQATEDITIVILTEEARFPPRRIATGWARLDIKNGAQVQLVGYGAIDQNAQRFKNELQEAATTITDATCSERPGCNPSVAPGGELGAGGMGVDTCPGDSGGPLYLKTSYGDFLAGVTSRAYDDATVACRDGGIYARPDAVIDQLEQMAGVPLARGPEPMFDKLVAAAAGDGVETPIMPNDPVSDEHTFELTTPPARGTAKLRADGVLRVCTDPAAPAGSTDAVTVTITDAKSSARRLAVTIPVGIGDGAPTSDCDVDAFETVAGGGCCDGGRGGATALPLAALGLLALRRRRR